ncbi:MAG: enoyl-CoA hydratase/isomerase family protein [Aeromicrobium sp.]
MALTLVPTEHEDSKAKWQVGVPDVSAAIAALSGAVAHSPTTAQTLVGLLRLTATAPVQDGLVAESLAYSMLMAGEEHRRWLEDRSRRLIPTAAAPVTLKRNGDLLIVALNRPERHNAFGREVRDGLVEAFDLVAVDDSITRVRLVGNGPSFCSGGDLDEFGLTQDVSVAHLIRVERSVAARIEAVRSRVEVELHGACIGAGTELAAFADRVVAHPDARIQLPELAMGLVPGAGGTVGVTRRIGRWRTAWMALSGEPLPATTALRWGLVDELAG